MKMSWRRMVVCCGVLTVLLAACLPARADSKADLQERFRKRLPEVNRLKAEGNVGETWDGWLEPVKGRKLNEKESKFIAEENRDRKELYGIIADEEKTTPDVVAERNAQRKYRTAKPREWFKLKNGDWKQKE